AHMPVPASWREDRNPESSRWKEPETAPRQAERNLTLTVFHPWLGNKLATLAGQQISRSARAALTRMPAKPIAPNPPQPKDCEVRPADVTSVYVYPRLDFDLDFNVLRYSSGPRLASVICRSNETSKPIAGGIATRARRVGSA